MKISGISIPNFKDFIRKDGKTVIEKDHAKVEAKLDVCTKLKRRNSKRVRVSRAGKA